MAANEVILETLLEKYFDLCREEEDVGKNPKLTAKIDRLEVEIRLMRGGAHKNQPKSTTKSQCENTSTL